MAAVMQLGIILAVSFAGEALAALLPLPVPGSVYGLCLMLVLLCTGVLKADSIRKTATFLIEMMPLLFVPGTVGLMESWGVLKPALVPFILAVTAVTAVVMAVTGLVVEWMEQKGGRQNDRLSE